MKVGLFIPCYVDQFYPQAGIATYRLLKKIGLDVDFPMQQTCCGQPMANAGFENLSQGCNEHFTTLFNDFDYIVSPSGSCTLHIKEHLHSIKNIDDAASIKSKVYELCEFLTDIVKVNNLNAKFSHRVGIHQSCHGQRGLKLSQMSEVAAPNFNKPLELLKMVNDIDIVLPERVDECCGFGGTFCVTEEAVSVKMGQDRIKEHASLEVDYITGGDLSCLMHLDGILRRNKSTIKIIHIAEILNAE